MRADSVRGLGGTAMELATPRWPAYLRDALIVFSGLSILVFLYFDIVTGGNDFKQGDWLVSNSFQTVRRGLFGSALLKVSDAAQVSPLLVLGLVQAALVIALYVMT